jgi:acetylornithine deacetylase/succinyl-diaminopimelate desuccinylase-like protein
MTTTAHDYAREHAETFRQQLHDFLKIPGISTDSAYDDEVHQAAEWLRDTMQQAGLTAELIEPEDGHPLVYGEWLQAGDDAPTVLVYGHYDVQPAKKADGWSTEPFEPVEKDGFIYARGATDDKGQMFTHVKAVDAIMQAEGALPVNIKFIIEGEEESGSEAITRFVNEQPDKLTADVCVISDTSMSDIEQPVIVNALRGYAIFELTVTGPDQDLHSGMFGGTVHNPLLALSEIIAQFHNDDGSIAVPGFYDDVQELTDSDHDMINQLEWDNVTWAEDTGAPLPWGEANYTLLERIGARPTLEINGMAGGYFDQGFKAIVPHRAWAKISCRLVAHQDPDDIADKVKRFVKKIAPPTVKVDMEYVIGSPAVLVNTDNPMMQAAITAYEKAWGATPVFKREGGSIPIVSAFQNQLNLPVVLMGFGLNSDNLHGPDEHFSIEMFHKGIDTAIQFYHEVAQVTSQTTDTDE